MQTAFIESAVLWFYGLYLNYKNSALDKRVAWMFFFIAIFIMFAGIFKTTLQGIPVLLASQIDLERNFHLFTAHGYQLLGLLILLEHIKYSDEDVNKISYKSLCCITDFICDLSIRALHWNHPTRFSTHAFLLYH